MRWEIDSEYFGKVIKCIFDEFALDRAMLIVEGNSIYLLSDEREFNGCSAADKRGFKYSFWVGATYDGYVACLSEVRLARKYNHEQE